MSSQPKISSINSCFDSYVHIVAIENRNCGTLLVVDVNKVISLFHLFIFLCTSNDCHVCQYNILLFLNPQNKNNEDKTSKNARRLQHKQQK